MGQKGINRPNVTVRLCYCKFIPGIRNPARSSKPLNASNEGVLLFTPPTQSTDWAVTFSNKGRLKRYAVLSTWILKRRSSRLFVPT